MRKSILVRKRFARGSVNLFCSLGDMPDPDIRLERPLVAVNEIVSLIVNRSLANLPGYHARSPVEPSIENQAATNSGPKGHANDVRKRASGAIFPFCIRHRFGIVLQVGDKPGLL